MGRIKHQITKWVGRTITLLIATSIISGCLSKTETSDPVVIDFPVAYVKRPIPVNNQNQPRNLDIRALDDFNAGADLYLKARSTAGATERNITAIFTQGMGDVKDIEVSYDGGKLLFSMRAAEIEDADEDEQPTWNIWEYTIAENSLRRIITSDITAEAGEDVAPHYLPDGRIIYSSTRQRQSGAILLDEGKPKFTAGHEGGNGPAFSLHVMNSDGSDIHQVSFNQSHDFDASVIASGEVVFSRWDAMGENNVINLYKMNPDGTNLQLLYGGHSHDSGNPDIDIQFTAPRELPDGRLLSTLLPFRGSTLGGDIVAIDINHYGDNRRALDNLQSLSTTTAQNSLVNGVTHNSNAISPGGLYRSATPLWDGTGRLLVSWSPCRLINNDIIVTCNETLLAQANTVAAPPLYSVYVYDPIKRTHAPLVIPAEGTIIADALIAQPRPRPATIIDSQINSSLGQILVNENSGILHIRSVYDFDGNDNATPNIKTVADPLLTSADNRPARFLRIIKGVALPDRQVLQIPNSAFGVAGRSMREIIGYAAIEPDGSVMVKLPANVPLTLDVLDKNGRSITPRHQNWLQLRPGETQQCNGCHTHSSGIPHGRNNLPATVNSGATTSGLPFLNTNTTLVAQMGETMAQSRMRISCASNCAALTPSVDVLFDDHWTNTTQRAKDSSIAYRYADLTTAIPVSSSCINQWNSLCRTVINYETHIHPLWNKDRGGDSCTLCHTSTNSSAMPQVPAAQLDLSDGLSSEVATNFNSYRELLFADNEVELDLVNNILRDRLVADTDNNGNPRFETDADGNQILDNSGQPIPIMIPVPANGPVLSANGANGSQFFTKFDAGGSHAGRLSAAELRLIAEWIDIGGQYYNNPFDVPQ